MAVEPIGLFQIIKIIFQEERIHYAIADAKVKIQNSSIVNSNNRVNDFSLQGFLLFLEEKSREVNRESIYDQFYEFLASISDSFKISTPLVIEATNFLLNHNRAIFTLSESNNSTDYNYEYIDRMNNLLIKMLETTNNLNENELNELLQTAELSPLILVKIKILSLLKNYKKCLDVILQL